VPEPAPVGGGGLAVATLLSLLVAVRQPCWSRFASTGLTDSPCFRSLPGRCGGSRAIGEATRCWRPTRLRLSPDLKSVVQPPPLADPSKSAGQPLGVALGQGGQPAGSENLVRTSVVAPQLLQRIRKRMSASVRLF